MTVLFYLPLLVAFSGDGRAAAEKPSSISFPAACAVVTRADVEQALGRPVGRAALRVALCLSVLGLPGTWLDITTHRAGFAEQRAARKNGDGPD